MDTEMQENNEQNELDELQSAEAVVEAEVELDEQPEAESFEDTDELMLDADSDEEVSESVMARSAEEASEEGSSEDESQDQLETNDAEIESEYPSAPLYMSSPMTLEAQVEAIVFASQKPLKPHDILDIISDSCLELEDIDFCLQQLVQKHASRCGGFKLVETGRQGYQFQTVSESGPLMAKMFASRPRPISKAALETLAIIAYRQPVTRAEAEFIRGVDVASIFRNLLERDLIKCVGRKEIPGRPMLFGTTDEFLKVFNLKSLKDLPPLESFQPSQGSVDEAEAKLDTGETLVDVENYIGEMMEKVEGDEESTDSDEVSSDEVTNETVEVAADDTHEVQDSDELSTAEAEIPEVSVEAAEAEITAIPESIEGASFDPSGFESDEIDGQFGDKNSSEVTPEKSAFEQGAVDDSALKAIEQVKLDLSGMDADEDYD